MGIAFLVLISAISTRGIALDQENAIKNCGTIAEYLQNVVEEDNRLAKENVALREKIKELQDKLKDLTTNELSDVKVEKFEKMKDEIQKEIQRIDSEAQRANNRVDVIRNILGRTSPENHNKGEWASIRGEMQRADMR